MAQRVYMFVVDDDGDEMAFQRSEEFFNDRVLQYTRYFSTPLSHVELTVSAEDADPEDYPEGSPRDDGDILSELGDTVEDLQRQIDQKRRK